MKKLIRYFSLNIFFMSAFLIGMELKKYKKRILLKENRDTLPTSVQIYGTLDIINSLKKIEDKESTAKFVQKGDDFEINSDGTLTLTRSRKKLVSNLMLVYLDNGSIDIANLISNFSETTYDFQAWFGSELQEDLQENLEKAIKLNKNKIDMVKIGHCWELKIFTENPKSPETMIISDPMAYKLKWKDSSLNRFCEFSTRSELRFFFDNLTELYKQTVNKNVLLPRTEIFFSDEKRNMVNLILYDSITSESIKERVSYIKAFVKSRYSIDK